MILAYNTNGMAHHDPMEALEVLAETGYRGVSLTIDHLWLNPHSPHTPLQRDQLAKKLGELNLSSVIETGARFLLDARRKHWPSLVASPENAAKRLQLIEFACQTAHKFRSRCVSIWSGTIPDVWDSKRAWDALATNMDTVLKFADRYDVLIGFEPEPGMFVDTIAAFEKLQNRMAHPRLKLTMDIGHLFCQDELPIDEYIRRSADHLVNVHIEDMRAGVHEHLMFEEGDIDFPPVIKALFGINYSGLMSVELSRHSHDAVNALTRSMEFLKPLLERYRNV